MNREKCWEALFLALSKELSFVLMQQFSSLAFWDGVMIAGVSVQKSKFS